MHLETQSVVYLQATSWPRPSALTCGPAEWSWTSIAIITQRMLNLSPNSRSATWTTVWPGKIHANTKQMCSIYYSEHGKITHLLLFLSVMATSKLCLMTSTIHCQGMYSKNYWKCKNKWKILNLYSLGQMGEQSLDGVLHVLWRRHPKSLGHVCRRRPAGHHHPHRWVEVPVLPEDGRPSALQHIRLSHLARARVVSCRCLFTITQHIIWLSLICSHSFIETLVHPWSTF